MRRHEHGERVTGCTTAIRPAATRDDASERADNAAHTCSAEGERDTAQQFAHCLSARVGLGRRERQPYSSASERVSEREQMRVNARDTAQQPASCTYAV